MIMGRLDLTQDHLKSILDYDLDTGIFTWIKRPNHSSSDGIAGSLGDTGYLIIGISGYIYKSHRLAWLYVYGEWPKGEIDHIDMNKQNNSIKNLIESNRRLNMSNNKRKSSGRLTGTRKNVNKWIAQMTVNKKYVYLGTFDTELKAHKAYIKAVNNLRLLEVG
jgi:hypothetical protein